MMVTFFPWAAVEREEDLGGFALVPYRRGTLPAGPESGRPDPTLQGQLDTLFEHFHESHGVPINVATVLRFGAHGVTDELTEDEREDAFLVADLVTFGGLAAREFFSLFGVGPYCNSDNFQLIIQGFRDWPGGAAVSTRKRDGGTLAYVTEDANHTYAPRHVRAQEETRLDVPLIRALLAARESEHWQPFEEAVFWFNRANTDSTDIREQSEAVMMVGAFERVLGLHGGSERKLAAAFTKTLVPAREVPVSAASRVPADRFRDSRTIREAWVRDFFRVRGAPAHGRRDLRYPSVWPLKEHLLLGAYAFPLVVKILLSRAPLNLYALTGEDRAAVDLFERLASEDAFAHMRELAPGERERDRPRPAWQRLRREQLLEPARERLSSLLAALPAEERAALGIPDPVPPPDQQA